MGAAKNKKMQKGKYKCKQLKAVRKRIADENGIPLEQKECTYEGPCRGTCPHCEAELRYLESALSDRLKLGRVATVAGLSLGLAACGGGTNNTVLTTVSDTTTKLYEEEERSESEEVTIYPEVTTEGLVIMDSDLPEPPPPIIDDDMTLDTIDEIIPVVGEIVEGDVDDDEMDDVYTVVDEDPIFPGGVDSLYKFFADNIEYPQRAKDNKISGRVFVTFIVEPDGSVSNPIVLRDIGGGCGKEAVRVVKLMPRWNPGRNKGEAVRVRFTMPIKFTLTDE